MSPAQHQEYERRVKRSRRWDLFVPIAIAAVLTGSLLAAWKLS